MFLTAAKTSWSDLCFQGFLFILAFIRFLLLNFPNSHLQPSKLVKTHNFLAAQGHECNLRNKIPSQQTTVRKLWKFILLRSFSTIKLTHAWKMKEVCEISWARSQFPAILTTSTQAVNKSFQKYIKWKLPSCHFSALRVMHNEWMEKVQECISKKLETMLECCTEVEWKWKKIKLEFLHKFEMKVFDLLFNLLEKNCNWIEIIFLFTFSDIYAVLSWKLSLQIRNFSATFSDQHFRDNDVCFKQKAQLSGLTPGCAFSF